MAKRGRRALSPSERRFNELVGKRIEALRKQAGISGTELARVLGISRSQLYWMESGRTAATPYTLLAISMRLGVKVSVLTQMSHSCAIPEDASCTVQKTV